MNVLESLSLTHSRTILLDHIKVLHAAGIHHHDIRGDNIVVNGRREVKLVDFHTGVKTLSDCAHCPDNDVIGFLENALGSTRKRFSTEVLYQEEVVGYDT